jgi:hypothetical protein
MSTLAPNVPAMYELHFAIPMAGAILCTLNSCLDATMVSEGGKTQEKRLNCVLGFLKTFSKYNSMQRIKTQSKR